MRTIAGVFPHLGERVMNGLRNQVNRWQVRRQVHYERDREERLEKSYSVLAPEVNRVRKVKRARGQNDERANSVVCASIK